MILNCESIETARRSAAEILGMSADELGRRLRKVRIRGSEDPRDQIAHAMLGPVGISFESPLMVCWFHASRVEDPAAFKREGILTKSVAMPRLAKKLKELARGLERVGDNPFDMSLMGKLSTNDEGPYAFLIRTDAVEAPGATHAYWAAPESVQDLAGAMLGENFQVLVERFADCTQPCLVKFRGPGSGRDLAHALRYLHLAATGSPDVEAAEIANTCFSGMGRPIPPSDVVDIEVLK